jgi:hypothetical protein
MPKAWAVAPAFFTANDTLPALTAVVSALTHTSPSVTFTSPALAP